MRNCRHHALRICLSGVLGVFVAMAGEIAHGQNSTGVFLLNGGADSVVDTQGLLAPRNTGGGRLFGRSLNAVAHQSTPLLSVGDYQYTTWYRLGADENVMLGRRSLIDPASGWETLDTGLTLQNGDGSDDDRAAGIPTQTQPWDNHNAINIGISGDGRIHLAYDHHTNPLNYVQSVAGAATGTWTRNAVFGGTPPIQDSFRPSDSTIFSVTYPRFATNLTTGDMVVTYRIGSSSNGDLLIANYDSAAGQWSQSRVFIEGTENVTYTDSIASSSLRNPYLNDINYGPAGALHATFTWRETANGTANHDINYITSNDDGQTWLNDSGDLVANVGSTVSIGSPGIIIGSDTNFVSPGIPGGSSLGANPPIGLVDREQTLINQQGQAVDLNGGVHVLMWQREDPSTFSSDDFAFDSREAAYFHYFKDPTSGIWLRSVIPRFDVGPLDVGSRPKIAFDQDGNVYAAFLSPGVARAANRNYLDPGGLVIAGASASSNYSDWNILYHDPMIYEGEPLVDQQRLLRDGILSVLVQDANLSQTGLAASNIRVYDFELTSPSPDCGGEQIIYEDSFSGAADDGLGARTPDISSTGADWITAFGRGDGDAVQVFNADGSIVKDGPNSTHNAGALLPFEIESNKVYTLEASFLNDNSGWVAVGFSSSSDTLQGFQGRHSNGSATEFGGYAWVLSRNSPDGTDQEIFDGIGTAGFVVGNDLVDPAQEVTVKIVLDTTDPAAITADYYINETQYGGTRTLAASAIDDISFVGISSDGQSGNGLAVVSSFSLSSVSDSVLLGDVDLNGTVDFLDISPFISVLSDGIFQCEADCDGSGAVDFLDISPFIAILSGS